jgi:DNA processing protein
VPGPIGSDVSVGTNQLIKQGAVVVTGVDDIVEALEGVGHTVGGLRAADRSGSSAAAASTPPRGEGAAEPSTALPADLPPESAALLGALDSEPLHIDDLAAVSRVSSGQALAALLHLELLGVVESLPGKLFRKKP